MKSIDHKPTFSVIIATYNRAHLVGRATRSVLAQTYQDFEIIVVDDASTDNTPAVMKAFDDPQIIYIRREQNGGVAAANNTAIKKTRGKYVCFLGDDDEYLPNFLMETYQAFETTPETVGFSWSGVRVVRDNPTGGEQFLFDKVRQPKFENREQAYLAFLKSRPAGSGCGFTVRSNSFDVVGLFDERLRSAVDADFLIRLVKRFDYVVIPKTLVKVHQHSGPKVNKPTPQRAMAYEWIIKKNIESLRQHRTPWIALHFRTGRLYYQAGDNVRARKFLLRTLSKHPFHMKSWITMIRFEIFGNQPLDLRRRLLSLKSSFIEHNHIWSRPKRLHWWLTKRNASPDSVLKKRKT